MSELGDNQKTLNFMLLVNIWLYLKHKLWGHNVCILESNLSDFLYKCLNIYRKKKKENLGEYNI